MKAAILRPDLPRLFPPPPELMAFQTERRFYQEFGAAAPPLALWPERKLHDYTLIMQVIDEVERAERDKQSAAAQAKPGGNRGGNGAATEEAFRRMREEAGLNTPPPA